MPTFPTGATDIQSETEATQALARLDSAKELAVDLEADSMHAFRARLCFVQVGTDDEIFLFDTLVPGVDVGRLKALFADPSRTKFIHAAGGDLQFLAEVGVRVHNLFDTHRAATLLGWPKVGLADLAREQLGVELLKEHQQSDFSLRPLPPDMRTYIADDVRYLCELGRRVRDICDRQGILEEVLLDCERMADEAVIRPEVGADFRPKLPRGSLSAAQLTFANAVVQKLHMLRLQWAEAANVPMGRMLANAALIEIASRPPTTLKDLSRLKGVRGGFARTHGPAVLAVLEALRAQQQRGELQPAEPAAKVDAGQRKRVDKLKAFRTAEAVKRKVTPSVVLSNALVEDLAKHPPSSLETLAQVPYLGQRRLYEYGPQLIELLR